MLKNFDRTYIAFVMSFDGFDVSHTLYLTP